MRLIKQVQLFFQEGSSDKVYEIDLCEVGDGFVVNFRYGKRGAALKDGTKTIFPVDFREAEKVFESLEQEKRKKGYLAVGEAQIDNTFETKPKATGPDKRRKVVLRLLKAAAAGEGPENWPISRLIWRAGELKISEATPSIIKLVDETDTQITYAIAWSVARCGTSSNVPFLQKLRQQINQSEFVQRIIDEAILHLSEEKEAEIIIKQLNQTLPELLRKTIEEKNYKQLDQKLREYLFKLKTASNEYLITLYQVARFDYSLLQLFRKVLEDIPLRVNYFKYLRHIFKTAEMIGDFETYGIIAKNIEKQTAGYISNYWSNPQNNPELSFSNKSKEYLTRRVLRWLKEFGMIGDDVYLELASGVLLAFDDELDKTAPRMNREVSYEYNNQTRAYNQKETITHYDSYSRFRAFNYILYTNSRRYNKGKLEWTCAASYIPGNPAPAEREEAFPSLWNKAPHHIIRLLQYSKAEKVHEFANKVFSANPSFEEHIEVNHIIHFLYSPYTATQQLGLDLARKKFNRNAPDHKLLIALLDNPLGEARKFGEQLILELKSGLLTDNEFVFNLLKMKSGEAHSWLRGFLPTISFNREQASLIIGKIMTDLITAEISTEEDERYTMQLGDSLLIIFGEHIKYIQLDIIKDLFKHTSSVIHALAGKILLKHEVKPEHLPAGFLEILLTSDNPQSRSLGIELLSRFPSDLLLQKKEILVSFCLSSMPDVRNSVKPLIFKLTKEYSTFGKELVELFVPAFLMKESYEGLHEDLISLLSNELSESLYIIDRTRILLLLNSKFKAAQNIGNVLLKKNLREEDFEVPEMVKLASNQIEEVRIFGWNCFRKNIAKIKVVKDEAIRITDSEWIDTRVFAFDFFRKEFTAEDWNTNLLVSLCDSTKEDVQDFGREMITKCFREDEGTEYLLKLSQHPNTRLQLFTTSYLEKYASGNKELIEQLKPFFITLLSQVNKGKAAKSRAFLFLKKEGLKNEGIATISADIFTRISATMAISEKAECIAALKEIQMKYPSIGSPLKFKTHADYIKG